MGTGETGDLCMLDKNFLFLGIVTAGLSDLNKLSLQLIYYTPLI